MINKDGMFVLSEGKSLSVLGLKPGQVVGQSAYELYKDYPKILDDVKAALAGKTVRDVYSVKGVSGEDITFDTFFSPLNNDSGDVDAMIGMSIDITDLVNAKKELQAKIDELERTNKLMIARELRMAELKKEIHNLEDQTAEPTGSN